METQRPHSHLALALLLPLVPAVLACFQIANLDIGFHIATARAIMLSGTIPKTNILSFATPDQPWILHQWLPALLFGQLHDHFGPAAMILAKCAVIYGVFLLLWLAMARRATHRCWALLWFFVAVGASSYRFFVRPFVFSMLALAAVLYLLTRYHEQRKTWLAFSAVGVIGIASALHSGVVYSLLVVGAWLAAASVIALRERSPDSWRALALAGGMFAAALGLVVIVVSLTSPWGAKTLLLPFTFSSDPFLRAHIKEMRPLPFSAIYGFSWLLVALSPILLAQFIARRRDALRDPVALRLLLFEVAILGGFTFVALKHRRLVFVHALTAAYCLARWSDSLLSERGSPRLVRALVTAAALIAGGLAGIQQFTHYRFGLGIDQRSDPQALLAFVGENKLPARAFVSDAWGGRWLWAFYPKQRVFYDNRIEAYPRHFLRDVYTHIRYAKPGWRAMLDRYQIEMLVLKYSTDKERTFQRGKPNIRDRVFGSKRWRLVYWDDKGMIYLRAEKVPAACKRCGDYRLFNPDTQRSLPTTAAALLMELHRAWSTMPSGRACYALAGIHAKLGRHQIARALLRDGLRRFPENAQLLRLATRLTRKQ